MARLHVMMAGKSVVDLIFRCLVHRAFDCNYRALGMFCTEFTYSAYKDPADIDKRIFQAVRLPMP